MGWGAGGGGGGLGVGSATEEGKDYLLNGGMGREGRGRVIFILLSHL